MSCFHSRRAILLCKLIQPRIKTFLPGKLVLSPSLKLVNAYTVGSVLSSIYVEMCHYAI
jgi:hypothetical protein